MEEECVDRVIMQGERHLRRTIAELVAQYHGERNHEGIGNELIQPLASRWTRSGSPTPTDRCMLTRGYRRKPVTSIDAMRTIFSVTTAARLKSWSTDLFPTGEFLRDVCSLTPATTN
jgi:hypothetical protein